MKAAKQGRKSKKCREKKGCSYFLSLCFLGVPTFPLGWVLEWCYHRRKKILESVKRKWKRERREKKTLGVGTITILLVLTLSSTMGSLSLELRVLLLCCVLLSLFLSRSRDRWHHRQGEQIWPTILKLFNVQINNILYIFRKNKFMK